MNGEVENTNEKKKQIRLAIVGIVALLLLTLGATFAYFLIDTDNSTSNSNIKGDIDPIDSIALQKVTENLHVNLNSADMALANQNTEYYGDDAEENNYVKTLTEGIHTLGKLTANGGNGKTKYMCTANAVITMQVATENDMGKYFETGDAYLYINAGTLQQRIDLSELRTSGTRTIPFEIGITSEGERILEGYVEIINRDDDQTYLANKKLNIDVTFQDLDCDIGTSEVEKVLRDKDTDKKLTENLINGMYRYQGNSTVYNAKYENYNITYESRTDTVNNNYICLGSECSTAESNDMYRIIGVTEDGLIKVIKNTPSNDSIAWNSDKQTDIKWPESELYQYLNNEFYKTLSPSLKAKILNTTWLYGDVNPNNMSSEEQEKKNEYLQTMIGDGDTDTKKEAAKNFAKLYSDWLVKEEAKATDKTTGKVGLMSIMDYCSSFESEKNLSCFSSYAAMVLMSSSSGESEPSLDTSDTSIIGLSWLTIPDGVGSEWTMSRFSSGGGSSVAWYVDASGFLDCEFGSVSSEGPIRPIFFLKSDIKISGEGTLENPFRVAGMVPLT